MYSCFQTNHKGLLFTQELSLKSEVPSNAKRKTYIKGKIIGLSQSVREISKLLKVAKSTVNDIKTILAHV